MESIERGQPFAVVVDFAHTPQALANALATLRQHTAGRLLLAFGNAGERDPASRPAMGRLAAELSDFFVITMDDPLHEDPAAIASQTARGAEALGAQRGRNFEIVLDRREAIRLLLKRAEPGDAVLLAGKGHEPRMLIGDARLPWDDRSVAEALLTNRGA
jgi:UDP-N-acetylmuramoyl-L-alanyl-D-glutamate--2,6-diaminopimelate ligase